MDPSIVTVVGTLGGVALGAMGSWWMQERQLEHQTRTRFHDVRLQAYIDFSEAANSLFAAATIGQWDGETVDKLQAAFAKVRICGSMPVMASATQVFALAADVMRNDPKRPNAELGERIKTEMTIFLTAARQEIDVDRVG